MSIFTDVKQHVKPKECLRFYLGTPKKEGQTYFYISPFRNEKTASFAANDKCGISDFGDGQHYDVISFVGRLFNLSNLEAAKKLASDFHISTNDYRLSRAECKEFRVQKGLEIWREEARKKLRIALANIKKVLQLWTPEEVKKNEEIFAELILLKANIETWEDILNCSYDRNGWLFVLRELGGDFIGTK